MLSTEIQSVEKLWPSLTPATTITQLSMTSISPFSGSRSAKLVHTNGDTKQCSISTAYETSKKYLLKKETCILTCSILICSSSRRPSKLLKTNCIYLLSMAKSTRGHE